MSAATASALPPAPVICAAASLAAWAARSTIATAAPSRANSSAAARPIPEPAPVTTATLPASLPLIGSCLPERRLLPLRHLLPRRRSERGHAPVDDQRMAG